MKKILSVFLVLCLMLSFVPAAFAADEQTVKIAVTSDLHIDVPSAPPAGEGMFDYASGTGSLTRESTAIVKAFLSSAKANGAEYVLIAGDITDHGSVANFAYAAGILADFEAEYGIPVFVINGNHDVSYYGENAKSDFKSAFARFGYGEALEIDPNSCSYTVNLSDSYRLLAIDSCAYGANGDGLDEARLAWVQQQVDKAKADNVKLIAMQHHNVVEHFGMQSTFAEDFVVKNYKSVAAKYADWGIKYVFTGHVHMHDISSYTSDSGNEIYDILTTALTTYPLKYRTVSFTDSYVSINTIDITSIDLSLLAEGYSEEQKTLLKSDTNAYAKGYFEDAMADTILPYLNASRLRGMLAGKIDGDSDIFSVLDTAAPKIYNAVTMPLYSSPDGKTLSSIAAQYNISIPASNFNTLFDALLFFIEALSCGDEYYPVYCTETQTLLKGVSAGLNYALDGIDTATATGAIKDGLSLIGYQVSDQLASVASGLVTNRSLIDLIVSKVLTPVVEQITVDTSPADNNIRLPGYNSSGVTAESFFQKFTALIRRVFAGILDLFYILFG